MFPHQFRDNAPSQLRSSYGMKTTTLFPRQHNSPKRRGGNERITGKKARGLQTEEVACKCQIFLSLSSGRRKQTSDICFLFYTNLKEVSFKILSYHDTWLNLKFSSVQSLSRIRLLVTPWTVLGAPNSSWGQLQQ